MIACRFCRGLDYIEDEYGEYKLVAVEMTPFPAINLTTGEREEVADPPYHVLFLKNLDEEYGKGELASFHINFCPVCGRQLNKEYPTHYDKGNLVLSASDWVALQKKLRDPETIRKRDEFFSELDKLEVKENPDGSWEVPFAPKENNDD